MLEASLRGYDEPSTRLDERLAKDDILYIYLNQIYFGHGNYGVEEAARFYFGVRARDLTASKAVSAHAQKTSLTRP